MKLQDLCPKLYNLYNFHYSHRERKYGRLSFEKTQYSYRLLCVDKGYLDVCFDGKTERLRAGDVLFLAPGTVYRLLPCDVDFSLANLFFNFVEKACDDWGNRGGCVFLSDYRADLCLPRVTFEDAYCFNYSRVFKNVVCGKEFEELFSVCGEDAPSAFYVRAKLLSIFAELTFSAERESKKNSVADEILLYIRRNPSGNLSPDELSKKFSYHKNHINRLIKGATGKSVSEYVRHVKIEYAKTLLSEGGTPNELSVELGYYDYSHFYKAFVAETGVSPTKYARKLK